MAVHTPPGAVLLFRPALRHNARHNISIGCFLNLCDIRSGGWHGPVRLNAKLRPTAMAPYSQIVYDPQSDAYKGDRARKCGHFRAICSHAWTTDSFSGGW